MNNFSHAYDLLTSKLYEWYEGAIKLLPNLAVAVLVLVIFFFIGKALKNLSVKLFLKTTGNPALARFLSQLISFIVGLLGLIIFLDIINLDKTITSLLAGAGILGLAFSLAFQDFVANFVSSVFILTRKPFLTGDIIQTNDIFGRVEKINMRATMLVVPEGQLVIIPNKMIMENPIRNYSTFAKRRIDVEVGIHYNDDPARALKIARDAIVKVVPLLEDHPVDTFMEEFGDSSLALQIRFWVSFSTQAEFLGHKSKALIAIHKAFGENGITIPFPIRTLEFGKSVDFGNNRPV